MENTKESRALSYRISKKVENGKAQYKRRVKLKLQKEKETETLNLLK